MRLKLALNFVFLPFRNSDHGPEIKFIRIIVDAWQLKAWLCGFMHKTRPQGLRPETGPWGAHQQTFFRQWKTRF